MKKNILVTGAAGFIGSFLCEALVACGYNVVGIDNFFRGSAANLSTLSPPHFILEELDLSAAKHIQPLQKILRHHRIEIVFHLAAINGTQYFYDQPLFVFDQNIKITQNLLAAIESTGVNYLIYSSSSEVYGDPLIIPTDEKHPIMLNISSDRDSYAASKAAADFYVRLFAQHHHMSCLILRIFNLYGERMVGTKYGQVVAEFVTRMLHEERFTLIGDGSQTRSFCYVKDAIWIIKQLMEKNITGLVNVGSAAEISILKLAQLLHALEHRPFDPVFLPPRAGDHQRRQPNISYLHALVPNIVFTPLESGLEKVIEYYRTRPGASNHTLLGPDT